MSTAYPSNIDTLENPTSSSTLLDPPHDVQHADANDAIEAIESELGTNPAGGHGSVKARMEAIEALLGAQDLESIIRAYVRAQAPTTVLKTMFLLGGASVGAAALTNGTRVGVGLSGRVSGATFQADASSGYHSVDTGASSGNYGGVFGPLIPAGRDFWLGSLVSVEQSVANQSFMIGAVPSGDDFQGTTNGLIGCRVSGTGTYTFVTDDGGTESVYDTTVTPAAGVQHAILIRRSGNNIECYFDGTLVTTITTNIPNAALIPCIGIRTATTAARKILFSDFAGFIKN